MSQLLEKLQNILTEKNKIKASDLPNNVNVFGIQGQILRQTSLGSAIDEIKEVETQMGSTQNIVIDDYIRAIATNINSERMIIEKGTSSEIDIKTSLIAEIAGITPEKIIAGNTILGIHGSASADIPFEDEEQYAEAITICNEILGVVEE